MYHCIIFSFYSRKKYTMNRIYCLYWVSTVQQLHEDGILMQLLVCQEFVAARG